MYSFTYKPYEIPFAIPLSTAHGIWRVRKGIHICLKSESECAWGEAAPIEAFGTESVEHILKQLKQIPPSVDDTWIDSLDDNLPCLAFAFSTAREKLQKPNSQEPDPASFTDNIYLTDCSFLSKQPLPQLSSTICVAKIKIGLNSAKTEISTLKRFVEKYPQLKIRLDANGNLSKEEFYYWLSFLKGLKTLDFFEQPLAPGNEIDMQNAAERTGIPLALDESAAQWPAFEKLKQSWQGYWIIKPALFGSIERIYRNLIPLKRKVIISSAFESDIGWTHVNQIAQQFPHHVNGLGTRKFLISDPRNLGAESKMERSRRGQHH